MALAAARRLVGSLASAQQPAATSALHRHSSHLAARLGAATADFRAHLHLPIIPALLATLSAALAHMRADAADLYPPVLDESYNR